MSYMNQIFKNIIDVAPSALLVVGVEREIVYANSRVLSLFDYTARELIGQPLEILVPREIAKEHEQYHVDCVLCPNPKVMGVDREVRGLRKDGTIVELEINLVPLGFSKLTILASIRDISERKRRSAELENAVRVATEKANLQKLEAMRLLKQATRDKSRLKKIEKKLVSSNRDLERLAYIASHDLQEPLRTISNYNQLLLDRYSDKLDNNAAEFMKFCVESCRHLQKMVRNLMVYSRLSVKKAKYSNVSLNQIVYSAIALLSYKIEETQAKITVKDLPEVLGEESQLISLYQNLISNAVKFCRESEIPCVEIGVLDQLGKQVFFVKDNGIGIPEKFRNQVFQMFRRCNDEDQKGDGIGLALCKKIVERHEGSIWVCSEPNSGSVFYFTLHQEK